MLLPFVGQWGSKEDSVVYVITNSLKLEIVESPVWKTIIKNIYFDGNKVSFDSFNFIENSNDHKTLIDQSGSHPFSGIRVRNELKLDSEDINKIISTISIDGKESFEDVYVRILND